MEKDFHFYLIYALAKKAGLDSSDLIAYASQFVDDNNEGQFSLGKEEVFFPERVKASRGYYYPIMTQSLSPKSLDPYVQKYVYVPFHFLPGENHSEIKGMRNPLSATPNSKNAQTILSRAMESNDPYRIGIALHTFADTWSHQNFSGLREEWNAVYPWYVFKSLVPNIGHAEAGHSPDVISETWTDYRLAAKKIENKQRAFEAVRVIYSALRDKSQRGPSFAELERDLQSLIEEEGYDDRIKKISDLLADRHEGSIPSYSKDSWIDAALDKKEGEVVMKDQFPETHWYRFHQATKAHLALVVDLLKGI